MRKNILLGRPSLILATLGGAAGAVLFAATAGFAAAAGAPALGLAEALGGAWVGSVVAFLVAWLVLPVAMAASWTRLPGDPESVGGALLKGALFGAGVAVLVGVLLPLLGAPAGLFAAADGIGGVLTLLIGSLGYGVVAAAVASMGRGMAPLHTLGWEGHGAGRAA